MNQKKSASHSWFTRIGHAITRYFMGGVLITVPIIVTIMIIHWVFMKMDSWLIPYIDIPGLGFVLVIVTMIMIGWIGSLFLIDRLFALLDRWMESLPGFSFIYSSVRDFIKAFVGKKRRFKKTVRVRIYPDEIWLIGFITDEDLQKFELGEAFIGVYVPQAYNVAGQLFLVPRERVHPLDDIGPGDAMRYAATGGAVEISAKN